jgi:hypothetical protein
MIKGRFLKEKYFLSGVTWSYIAAWGPCPSCVISEPHRKEAVSLKFLTVQGSSVFEIF